MSRASGRVGGWVTDVENRVCNDMLVFTCTPRAVTCDFPS